MLEFGNIFAKIPDASNEEVFEIILNSEHIKIERIISKGQTSPENFWYNQDWGEWVLLLQGYAIIEFENEQIIEMKPGDYLYIPPNKKHRVNFTAPDIETIWLAIIIKSI